MARRARLRRGIALAGGALMLGLGLALLPGRGAESVPRVGNVVGTARALEQWYNILVRYDDASRFVTPPLTSVPDRIGVTAMPGAEVPVALALVRAELAKYPRDFVRKTLGGVFLCGSVKSYGHLAGGLVFLSGIYLPGRRLDEAAEAREQFALTLHHELSSLTLARGRFPESAWRQLLPPGFDYPPGREAVLDALDTFDDAAALAQANADGFVSTYGKTSLENDFNTYAELVFGEPAKMAALAAQHARMRGKLKLFLTFHESLDPDFAAIFAESGLSRAAGLA